MRRAMMTALLLTASAWLCLAASAGGDEKQEDRKKITGKVGKITRTEKDGRDFDGLVLYADSVEAISDRDGGVITGLVVSRKERRVGPVQIAFILYDRDGKRVGRAVTALKEMGIRGRWRFRITVRVPFDTYELERLAVDTGK